MKKLMTVAILVVVFLASMFYSLYAMEPTVASLKDAAVNEDGIVQMEWFVVDSYRMDDGLENLTITFFYYEDYSQEVGYAMLDYSCETGVWYIDEITLTNPEYEVYYTGIDYVASEIVVLFNNNLDYSTIFPEWQPDSLYLDNGSDVAEIASDNRNMLRAIYGQSGSACPQNLNFTTYLPVISNGG